MAAPKGEDSWARTRWLLLGGAAVVVIATAVVVGPKVSAWQTHSALSRTYEPAALKKFFDEAEAVVKQGGGREAAPAPGVRAGKSLWIRAQLLPKRNRIEYDLQIDEDMARLPAEWRADAPGEVRTVVLVYPSAARVGEYVDKQTGRKHAYAWDQALEFVLVDLQKKKMLARSVLYWGPKQEITLGEEHIQARDSGAVQAWFAGLPDQP